MVYSILACTLVFRSEMGQFNPSDFNVTLPNNVHVNEGNGTADVCIKLSALEQRDCTILVSTEDKSGTIFLGQSARQG